MANVQITQLPNASAITGTESVPIVQNGVTVQTTTAALAGAPVLTASFLEVSNSATTPNSRYFAVGSGLATTDGGVASSFTVSLIGALANLNALGNGLVTKTSASVLANRTITAGSVGLSVTNGDGVSGNPSVSLSAGPVLTLAQAVGSGMLSLSSNVVTPRQLTGTANQITVVDGTGASGDPTFSITDNPILPGTASVKVPLGTTGQRPVGSNGQIRYNTSNSDFEFYENGNWTSYGIGDGSVTSIAMTVPTGLSVAGSPITTAGTLALTYSSGYSIPTNASQATWDTAYTLATTAVQSVSGTANQIDSTGTTAVTLTIASDPVMPGTAAITVPIGNTAQRGSVGDGAFRYNSQTLQFEGRINGTFTPFAAAGIGVSSVSTGTGLTGGPITSTGTISISNTGVSANTYGSQNQVPVFAVNAQGQITSVTDTAINSVALTTGTISTTPSSANDIVNKSYADSIAAGLSFHEASEYATTANLGTVIYNNGTSGVGATITKDTPFATLAIDGHTFTSPADIGVRVIIKDQATPSQNGVYTVTNVGSGASGFILTRATDFDTSGSNVNQINAGDFVFVTSGTVNANTSWVQQTPLPITVGSTSIVFAQFGAPVTYTAGTGLDLVGFEFSLETPVTLAHGGTGQTSANAALNALLPAQSANTYLKSDGTNTNFASLGTFVPIITHSGPTVQIPVGNGYFTVLLHDGITYVNITVF